jgi:uncharacterized heparinase superfamily protein
MQIINFPIFFRTIQFLKPEQIFYRIWYAIRTRARCGLPTAISKIPDHIHWGPLQRCTTFLPYRWTDADDITQGTFKFTNDTAHYGTSIDWQPKDKNRLWRYNLHYFQYLHSNGGIQPEAALRLAKHWIDHNPPGSPDAWDPYPVSLRLVSWIKYLSSASLSQEVCQRIVRSAYQQALWLEQFIEYHLLGNHLFKNAKALVFTGLFFKGRDAQRWLSKGMQLLDREINEQILPDGGHFERSPMYHAMILEDCLDLLNICYDRVESLSAAVVEGLRSATCHMVEFLNGISHPDGQISLFNDAAFGIEAQPADLCAYYEKVLGETPPALDGDAVEFPNVGYFIICPNPQNRMIIDCGPIGPQYLTGHAHCDTLSFELSLKGRRFIVDSGCFGYDEGAMRDYNRGNEGHNTLTVDGKNQSEVWKSHRCARRAQPLYAKLSRDSDGEIVFEGAHDGYRRLNGGPIHHRRISWSDNTYLIQDRVEGGGRHDVQSRLHIHPALEVQDAINGFVIRDKHDILARISLLQDEDIEKTQGWYCQEFGKKEKCAVLRTRHQNVPLPFSGGWQIKVEG